MAALFTYVLDMVVDDGVVVVVVDVEEGKELK